MKIGNTSLDKEILSEGCKVAATHATCCPNDAQGLVVGGFTTFPISSTMDFCTTEPWSRGTVDDTLALLDLDLLRRLASKIAFTKYDKKKENNIRSLGKHYVTIRFIRQSPSGIRLDHPDSQWKGIIPDEEEA